MRQVVEPDFGQVLQNICTALFQVADILCFAGENPLVPGTTQVENGLGFFAGIDIGVTAKDCKIIFFIHIFAVGYQTHLPRQHTVMRPLDKRTVRLTIRAINIISGQSPRRTVAKEISVFQSGAQAEIGHDIDCQRRIHVVVDDQIKRLGIAVAKTVGMADFRKQQTGLPFSFGRQHNIGKIKHRDITQVEYGVAGPGIAFDIDIEAGSL